MLLNFVLHSVVINAVPLHHIGALIITLNVAFTIYWNILLNI